MKPIVGIDIGGSTTKIVGFLGDSIINPMFVKADDAITSVFGALGKFISTNGLDIQNVAQIMVTGVGASYIKERIYGIPTARVKEFMALGLGGLYLSKLHKAVIVSMGTGTAFVRAIDGDICHYGGTGVGGGTLLGLSRCMLNIRGFESLMEMAELGDLSKIDLTIGDITKDAISNLPLDITASNFGKISELATKNDIALGILNLVLESIAMQAIFASRIDNIKDIVLTGNLTNVTITWNVFQKLMEIFPERFYLPPNAEYATAFGAALAYNNNANFEQLP